MKKLFYWACLGLIMFEIANVYFIMPIPGSQEINSIQVAYFLFSWRWWFRILFSLLIIIGLYNSFNQSKILLLASILLVGIIIYYTNFEMSADHMFLPVENLQFKTVEDNKIPSDRLIIGIVYKDIAKAYPIQFLGYHHQVRDTLSDKQFMITYCTVCRTGRVYEPMVDEHYDQFRLVGMDHFNAMFEDGRTKSWWRQSTGEAIAGPSIQKFLPEYPSQQMTLNQWITIHPQTLIMQPDTLFQVEYDSLSNYENGTRKGKLTRRDSQSWEKKSWIIGLELNGMSKAYDWNELYAKQIIQDDLNNIPIAVVLSDDKNSFASYILNTKNQLLSIQQDTIILGQNKYLFSGKSLSDSVPNLIPIKCYQEYWHSWQTFHPKTLKFAE
ncbi:MAG TPA: DUF3179 domain-containing (seleno)protein [Saprospiraceae bacterium]|nr:DUF3179 domain-containing (seleno)protein [Saprospiraceae bacterium]